MMAIISARRFVIIFVTVMCMFENASAQVENNYPEVNKPSPDFRLFNIENTSAKSICLSDLRGENVILDFWSTGCVPCIASFPKLDSFQRKYAGKLRIILIGLEERGRDIKKYYQVYKRKYGLELTSAYDSTTFKKFVHFAAPYLVWIDKSGIIKAITRTADEEQIIEFINDRQFTYYDASYQGQKKIAKEIDRSLPLLIKGNGGRETDYIFRSVLSKWRPGMGDKSYSDIVSYLRSYNEGRYQTTKADLLTLYQLAYLGTVDLRKLDIHPDPIIECKDMSAFVTDFSGKGFYNYCVEIPNERASKAELMKIMQKDLKSYFGHEVNTTEKQVAIFKLVIIDRHKFEKAIVSRDVVKFKWDLECEDNFLQNVSLSEIPSIINKYLPLSTIIEDQTGSSASISIKFAGDISDIKNITEILETYGIGLLSDMKTVKSLKISD